MAYQKMKKEQYFNVGGIDTRASVYITDDKTVLNLVNFDLQTNGAYTQRPGTTSVIIAIVDANTASMIPYYSFQTVGVPTIGLSSATAYLSTFSTYVVSNSNIASVSLGNGYAITAPSSITLALGSGGQGVGNAVTVLRDAYSVGYYSNGTNIFKVSTTAGPHYFGLPYTDTFPYTISQGGVGSLSGVYNFRVALQDIYGYRGPVQSTSLTITAAGSATISITGLTFSQTALASGATCYVVYRDRVTGYPSTTFVSIATGPLSATFISTTDAISTSLAYISEPNTGVPNLGGVTSTPYASAIGNALEFHQERLFISEGSGSNKIHFSEPIENQIDAQSFELESTLYLGNTNFPTTTLKSYNQSLIAFLIRGVFRITGVDLNSFDVQELSKTYGCLNARALVVFKDVLWFLDQSGIIEFNGANFLEVSAPIRSIFARMNITAAQKVATAYHYEGRKEVWFAFPIDGSDYNNIIAIFDYNTGGWYFSTSQMYFNMLSGLYKYTSVAGQPSPYDLKLYTGSVGDFVSSGTAAPYVSYFGEEFKTDGYDFAPLSYTMSFKTKYHAEQGHSVTCEWRRFYLDTGPWAGVTLSFMANFYANFATATVALTRTIYASGSPYSGPQQTRIDFGIPAKSLSTEISISSGASSSKVVVYGYTIESRFLRNV